MFILTLATGLYVKKTHSLLDDPIQRPSGFSWLLIVVMVFTKSFYFILISDQIDSFALVAAGWLAYPNVPSCKTREVVRYTECTVCKKNNRKKTKECRKNGKKYFLFFSIPLNERKKESLSVKSSRRYVSGKKSLSFSLGGFPFLSTLSCS